MGLIKFLNRQMIPWCFHPMMGNHICVQFRGDHDGDEPVVAVRSIKLIKSDGVVKIYHRPILVSELMEEFPKHLVCRSDSFYIGQKVPPLSEHDHLQLGHNYFLLPKHFFQSVLSFVTIASFTAASSSFSSSSQISKPAAASTSSTYCEDSMTIRNTFLKKAASFGRPFDIQKTPSGGLRIRVSEDFISQLMMDQEEEEEHAAGREINQDQETLEDGGSSSGKKKKTKTKTKNKTKSSSSSSSRVLVLCTTPQLQKDYTQLVRSRLWKPKLETIKESTREKKKKRKLSSFGMKRRPNKLPQSIPTGKAHVITRRLEHHHLHHHHHHVSSSLSSTTKPPSRHFLRYKTKTACSS